MKFIRFEREGEHLFAIPVSQLTSVDVNDRGTLIAWGHACRVVEDDYATVLARIEDGDLDQPFSVIEGDE